MKKNHQSCEKTGWMDAKKRLTVLPILQYTQFTGGAEGQNWHCSIIAEMRKAANVILYSSTSLSGFWAVDYFNDGKWSSQFWRNFRTISTAFDILGNYYWKTRNNTSSQETWNKLHEYASLKILRLFRQNGGVYIKFGQHLASLDYLIPIQFCEKMKVLFQQAPVSSQDDVDNVILEELGRPRQELFSQFDPIPLGAASLAQVHAAVLRETGERVAVKVQHKKLLQSAENDMKISSFLFSNIKHIFPSFQFDWLAEEIRANLPLEMNFIKEAENANRMAKHLQPFSDIITVPKTFPKYTTKRVLTMELVEGFGVTDSESIKRHKIKEIDIFGRISSMVCRMIFQFKLLHCDPHPGNLLIIPGNNNDTEISSRKSKSSFINKYLAWSFFADKFLPSWPFKPKTRWKLALLDHGLYRELSDDVVAKYAEFWHNLLFFSQEGLQKTTREMGISEQNYRIFSAMLSQSTWALLSTKMAIFRPHPNDICEVRRKSIEHFPSIVEILSNVPRELLLVFKTNEIVRSLERRLIHSSVPQLYLRNTLEYSFRYLWQHTQNYSLWHRLKLTMQYLIFRCTCLLS